MRNLFRLSLLVLGLTVLPPTPDAREVVRKGDTVVVKWSGEISPPLYLFLRRAIKAAETAGAGAIVIEMNTYGGRLDAAGDITGALNRTTIPTYTFINTNAGSAASLIAFATRHIYISPVSAIGARAPDLAGGAELTGTEKGKTLSYWSALVRSSSTRNGHNPDIREAVMDKG